VSLRGFGVDIIAMRVQQAIEGFYDIDHVADVSAFVRPATGGREKLLVREAHDGVVEMRLELPAMEQDLDSVCQVIEGVSHFVYVATRATQGRVATVLELEIQAEVDKYVVLSGNIESLDVARSARLRDQLYERNAYLHEQNTEMGERYRVANEAANRFTRKLERAHVAHRRFGDLRRDLHQFFRAGQEDKLRLAA
jgi:hypothetical protein